MFKTLTRYLKSDAFRRGTRKYLQGFGRQVLAIVRRDATKLLREQMVHMKFEDFRASKVVTDDVLADGIDACITYLGRYVVDIDSDNNLSINVGGVQLYETSLYKLEQKLFGLLTGSK